MSSVGVLGSKPVFAQTMLRVKDPKKSLDFYTRLMGMKHIAKFDFPDLAFTLYFLAYTDEENPYPNDVKQTSAWLFQRQFITLGTLIWSSSRLRFNLNLFNFFNNFDFCCCFFLWYTIF